MFADLIHFLTVPPSREVAEQGLHADLCAWFASTYGEPTLAQRYAWPAILGRQSFLLSSPTGSGKTLAAVLPILHEIATNPGDVLICLYVAAGQLVAMWRHSQEGVALIQRSGFSCKPNCESACARRHIATRAPALLTPRAGNSRDDAGKLVANAGARAVARFAPDGSHGNR